MMAARRKLHGPALFLLLVLALGAAPPARGADLADSVRVNPLASPQQASAWAAPARSAADPRAVALASRLRQPWSAHWARHTRFAAATPPTTEQSNALADLRQRLSGAAVEVELRHPAGTPSRIRGAMLERAAAGASGQPGDERTARAFLRGNRQLLRLDDPDTELALVRHQTDELGRRHLRFSHRYQGLPVWPSELMVHLDRAGNVDLMNGAFVATPRLSSLQPVVDAAAAIRQAEAVVPGGAGAPATAPTLIVYAPGTRPARLAWRLELRPSLVSHWMVVVDAETGAVLTAYEQVMDANVPGSGTDLVGTVRPLNVFQQGTTFFLVDSSKPMFVASSPAPPATTTRGAIIVLDAQNQPPSSNPQTVPPLAQITSGSATAGFIPDGVSAAFNLSETYDYYLQGHQRNSIDGQGGSIFGVVRYGRGYRNAFFLPDQEMMFFGDGLPFAGALDVVAHELTHGVTSHTANLVYVDQPGALNEAISDIFGELVEARTFGVADWLNGSLLGGTRDLKNPASREIIPGLGRRYPSRMSEILGPNDPFLNNFIGRDNGGVHINSTIISHAFYLLAEGLPGAIGLDSAGRIFYRALAVHLVANSQFIDARLACIQSAEELFGPGSPQALKTAEAFTAVEITEGPATPIPAPRPPVSSQDATLFTFRSPAGLFFLGRREAAFADPPEGIRLSRADIAASRPSVTSDGTLAIFVSPFSDVCLIFTDSSGSEDCLGFPGLVFSVAMSRDGSRFAFVFLDVNGQPENRINVIDVNASTTQTFTLEAPALDGTTVDAVLNADAMAFTADGRFLIYDALNQVRVVGGSTRQVWSIYALEFATGRVLALVPPVPGLDIGFPALGHTTDSLITFDALDTVRSESTIFSANLTTGDRVRVATSFGGYGIPSYTGDDRGVIYSQDDSTPSAASLFLQALAADHLTPVGSPALWLRDASSGVIYRRGAAPSTAQVTLSGTAFRPGQTLTLGINVQNPPSGEAADLYVGVILPDGRTALFFSAPGVVGRAASLSAPATFQRMQFAPPGFALDSPAFFRGTFAASGVPAGTYQVFIALVRQNSFFDNRMDIGDFLGFDIRSFTFSP